MKKIRLSLTEKSCLSAVLDELDLKLRSVGMDEVGNLAIVQLKTDVDSIHKKGGEAAELGVSFRATKQVLVGDAMVEIRASYGKKQGFLSRLFS